MNVCQRNRSPTIRQFPNTLHQNIRSTPMLRRDKWISIFYHGVGVFAGVTAFASMVRCVTWKPMPFHHVNGGSQSFFHFSFRHPLLSPAQIFSSIFSYSTSSSSFFFSFFFLFCSILLSMIFLWGNQNNSHDGDNYVWASIGA